LVIACGRLVIAQLGKGKERHGIHRRQSTGRQQANQEAASREIAGTRSAEEEPQPVGIWEEIRPGGVVDEADIPR
jgi:hypothetical protein